MINKKLLIEALKSFSCQGLRTLVMGYKTISMVFFNTFTILN